MDTDSKTALATASLHIAHLKQRLAEADETLNAIRNGEVDAVVVGGPMGQQIYTLENADRPYRLLIEQMQECALTLGTDGAILYCNQRLSTLTGIPREALVGQHVQDFVSPDDRNIIQQLLRRDGTFRRAAEFMLIKSDGGSVPVNMTVADLPIEEDMPDLLCGVITDLTSNRLRNEALANEVQERRRTEDSLQLALNAADMGHWDMDLLSGRTTRSARFDEIFGHAGMTNWTVQTSLGLFVDEDRKAVDAAFSEAHTSGTITLEKRIRRHSDGMLRWVLVRGLTYYLDGKAVRIAGIISDVTERRLVDEQLRQAQKMEAIGQLTGGVAHDFNNLLMVIAGSLDLLENHVEANEKNVRYLKTARQGVQRGAKLNQQLLAFSRRQDLRVQPVNVGKLLRTFENLLDRAIGETITVTIKDPDDVLYGSTDPHQLETAILNLAINARDAMPRGGALVISTTRGTIGPQLAASNNAERVDYVVVTVADTGSGMTADVLVRVFEPFFTTKDVGKGTGLGLSQVYGFAKQSGGFVTVDSVVGEGTSVAIYLPLVEASSGTVEEMRGSAEVKGQGTILVVEDDDDVREIACSMLRELGYLVLQANRGQSALTVIESGVQIDLVFSDVIMPGEMGGIELARRIKSHHATIAVLLTSGFTGQRFRAEGMDDGLPILRKPYSRVDLSLAIQSAIGAGH